MYQFPTSAPVDVGGGIYIAAARELNVGDVVKDANHTYVVAGQRNLHGLAAARLLWASAAGRAATAAATAAAVRYPSSTAYMVTHDDSDEIYKLCQYNTRPSYKHRSRGVTYQVSLTTGDPENGDRLTLTANEGKKKLTVTVKGPWPNTLRLAVAHHADEADAAAGAAAPAGTPAVLVTPSDVMRTLQRLREHGTLEVRGRARAASVSVVAFANDFEAPAAAASSLGPRKRRRAMLDDAPASDAASDIYDDERNAPLPSRQWTERKLARDDNGPASDAASDSDDDQRYVPRPSRKKMAKSLTNPAPLLDEAFDGGESDDGKPAAAAESVCASSARTFQQTGPRGMALADAAPPPADPRLQRRRLTHAAMVASDDSPMLAAAAVTVAAQLRPTRPPSGLPRPAAYSPPRGVAIVGIPSADQLSTLAGLLCAAVRQQQQWQDEETSDFDVLLLAVNGIDEETQRMYPEAWAAFSSAFDVVEEFVGDPVDKMDTVIAHATRLMASKK